MLAISHLVAIVAITIRHVRYSSSLVECRSLENDRWCNSSLGTATGKHSNTFRKILPAGCMSAVSWPVKNSRSSKLHMSASHAKGCRCRARYGCRSEWLGYEWSDKNKQRTKLQPSAGARLSPTTFHYNQRNSDTRCLILGDDLQGVATHGSA
jgi:hypothetical protein